MNATRRLVMVLGVAYAVGLGGCASRRASPSARRGAIPSGAIPSGNGVITAIDRVPGEGNLFRFAIRMNNGAVQTLRHRGVAGFRVGDHVRIRGGMMELM